MNLDPAGEMPEFSPTTYGDSVGTYAAVGNDSDAAKRAMESALRFRGLQNSLLHIPNTLENTAASPAQKGKANTMSKRIVKTFIADPHPAVPLEKSLLHEGEAKLTDSTDQELFFEVPIQTILEKHNAYRVTLTDKKASDQAGREIKLEPVRVRELRMVIVTLAEFKE